jgi:hypothetical protein
MEIIGEAGPLFAALGKAQAEFQTITRSKTVRVTRQGGGGYEFNYAPLEAILAAITPALNKNGLFLSQPLGSDDQGHILTTVLGHESGAYLVERMRLSDPQGGKEQELGSIVAYRRRYCLSILGIASEDDDDANVADGNSYQASQRTPAATPAKPPTRTQAVTQAAKAAKPAAPKPAAPAAPPAQAAPPAEVTGPPQFRRAHAAAQEHLARIKGASPGQSHPFLKALAKQEYGLDSLKLMTPANWADLEAGLKVPEWVQDQWTKWQMELASEFDLHEEAVTAKGAK